MEAKRRLERIASRQRTADEKRKDEAEPQQGAGTVSWRARKQEKRGYP
jgi:hypothetical protein